MPSKRWALYSSGMPTRPVVVNTPRTARALRSKLAEDLRRMCDDTGTTQAALAGASGVSQGFISEILAGARRPSIETYAKLAAAIGADLVLRLYPNTGPEIHDRHQAVMLEALLAELHPRWRAYPEVAVRQPARGWIDVVLHEERARLLLAVEIESGLHRLEQQLRWSSDKADSLSSWSEWPSVSREGTNTISRLLVVRRTRATRDLARQFARQIAAAHPAHPEDALAALTGTSPWPGPALIWGQVDGGQVRFRADRGV